MIHDDLRDRADAMRTEAIARRDGLRQKLAAAEAEIALLDKLLAEKVQIDQEAQRVVDEVFHGHSVAAGIFQRRADAIARVLREQGPSKPGEIYEALLKREPPEIAGKRTQAVMDALRNKSVKDRFRRIGDGRYALAETPTPTGPRAGQAGVNGNKQ